MAATNTMDAVARYAIRISDRHSGLTIRHGPNRTVIEGVLRLASGNTAIESFLIRIDIENEYPEIQPKVFEVGGRITNTNNQHVDSDQSLCLGVPEEIWMRLDGNYEINRFIQEIVEPYFMGFSCVIRGEHWPFGERGHGVRGLCEFYGDRFGTTEELGVLDIVQLLLGSELKGHWQCPCGSGKRLRKCHLQALIELRSKEIPRRLLVRTACIIGASVLKGTDKQVDELRRVAREMRELVGELQAA